MTSLPPGSEPKTIPEAYAVQDEVSKACAPIVGWKVAPSRIGGDIITGPLYQDTFIDGTQLSLTGLPQPLVEVEIAFRIRAAITATASDDDILGSLQCLPLFEIVRSRLVDFLKQPPLALLADNSAAGFIKLGTPVDAWRDLPAAQQRVRFTADGKVIEEFSYAEKMKTAVALVLAVIRGKDGRSRSLPVGTIITTGSMNKPSLLTGEIAADYGALGVNTLMLTP